MANFTTISRGKLKWQAPPQSDVSAGQAYELIIGDTHKLNIGSGFNLVVQSEIAQIQWTKPSKSVPNTWSARVTSRTSFLNIGGGYNLLINDTNQLEIGDLGSTAWSNSSKSNSYKW